MEKQQLTRRILLYLYDQAPDDKIGLSDLCRAVGESSKEVVLEELDRLEAKQSIQRQGIDREHILCWITYTGRQMVKEFDSSAFSANVAQAQSVNQPPDGSEKPQLPVTLQNKIIEFLASVPGIHDSSAQQAFIYSAGLDTQLQRQISFGGAPAQFFKLLVQIAWDYGKLRDGRDALEAVLETTKGSVGGDRRRYCDSLIEKLRAI